MREENCWNMLHVLLIVCDSYCI